MADASNSLATSNLNLFCGRLLTVDPGVTDPTSQNICSKLKEDYQKQSQHYFGLAMGGGMLKAYYKLTALLETYPIKTPLM